MCLWPTCIWVWPQALLLPPRILPAAAGDWGGGEVPTASSHSGALGIVVPGFVVGGAGKLQIVMRGQASRPLPRLLRVLLTAPDAAAWELSGE